VFSKKCELSVFSTIVFQSLRVAALVYLSPVTPMSGPDSEPLLRGPSCEHIVITTLNTYAISSATLALCRGDRDMPHYFLHALHDTNNTI